MGETTNYTKAMPASSTITFHPPCALPSYTAHTLDNNDIVLPFTHSHLTSKATAFATRPLHVRSEHVCAVIQYAQFSLRTVVSSHRPPDMNAMSLKNTDTLTKKNSAFAAFARGCECTSPAHALK
ncbi:hypothetical protein BAUCODRAFT_396244 [Baudoinia panamericana UAMH 10762]|uniref:Uncharacterized protein n=1 Tax=Baudoinia panamericana (strain UAMH 10762) TaxID=717646 RepID=M2N5E1_BAUPA|nr:uncharacterized protein BAUCODRAFT_396244 [Baudoinia panamericana UAMH 10762]EMC99248.1 hypothetical protein BAUCODRAFT_396244 [Baudoinia panamericana UAMH 10762]